MNNGLLSVLEFRNLNVTLELVNIINVRLGCSIGESPMLKLTIYFGRVLVEIVLWHLP